MVHCFGVEQELEIYFRSHTISMELLHSQSTSSSTRVVTTSISSLMVPSTRVCHISSTTVKLVVSSTSLPMPSVSSSTSTSMEESSPRESTSELSTLESLEADSPSSRES